MDQKIIEQFKERLTEEIKRLTEELSKLGRINPTNKNDWEPTYSNLTEKTGADEVSAEPDETDQADLMEEFGERTATEVQLEKQFNLVKGALERIEQGEYGWCQKEGERHLIEHPRLEANPSAELCMKHISE